jgi:hypothetical protein
MIRKIVSLVTLILLLIVSGCSAEEKVTRKKVELGEEVYFSQKVKNPYMTKKQGVVMDKVTFGENPIFKLDIEAENVEITVLINGVEIYRDFTAGHASMRYTIHDYLNSGDNEITVKLFADEKLKKDARCKVYLNVYSSDLKKSFDLNQIVYEHDAKEPLAKSTPFGSYRLDGGLKEDVNGSLFVDKVSTEPITTYRESKSRGVILRQKFYMTNPFPRWKYMDSDDILDRSYDNLSTEEYKALQKSPRIQALYDLDFKIRQAIKSKDLSYLKTLFVERSEESAKAFYGNAESNLKDFMERFGEKVLESEFDLTSWTEEEHYFIVEENCKLAWLRSISFKSKKTGLFHIYEMKYRYKNGEWILTK